MKKNIFIISFIVLIVDQFVKLLAINYLDQVVIIPNFLSLIYAENKGVAFSMLSGNRWVIIIISIILILFLIDLFNKEYKNKEKKNTLTDFTYGFLFGGIFGNLLDRIFRGVVIDYVSLNFFGYSFPIFNLADLFITFGVILLSVSILKNDIKKPSR